MIFEYDRVSTDEQNPERQHIAIAEYAAANNIKIDRTYEDKASGRNFQRPQYQAMKGTLRAGDTVIIKELDRMGRNMDSAATAHQHCLITFSLPLPSYTA